MAIIGKRPEGYLDSDIERRFDEKSPEKQKDRWAFEIDKGRIVHSGAFRRLQGKTQVLGVGERDFYRTRLTHSLEVAQIGRGICGEVKNPAEFTIDKDLVETICLAHDIGHAPFGHSGEHCLNKLMKDNGGFGSNAQNLRVVDFVETKLARGGLNLSRAALDGLTKYPTLLSDKGYSEDEKEFVYDDDKELFDWIKKDVRNKGAKPVECEIAEWADTAVYSVNDIEDNVRADLIDFAEVRRRAGEVAKECGSYNVKTDEVEELAGKLQKELVETPSGFRGRKEALKSWTSSTIFSLIRECSFEERDSKEECSRYRYHFEVPTNVKRKAKILKAISKVLVFTDPRVLTLEHKGAKVVRALFYTFVKDKRNSLLPRDFQEYIEENDPKLRTRIIADFISGMTDNYARAYYCRLFEPLEGSFYEHV
jgi:dGTPase